MTLEPWMYASAVAALGVAASCWRQLLATYQNLRSHVLVTMSVDLGYASEALLLHLSQQFQSSRYVKLHFAAIYMLVRPLRRGTIVPCQNIGTSSLYWRGWRPLWLSFPRPSGPSTDSPSSSLAPAGVTVMFLRGTFDAERLFVDAVQAYNAWLQDLRESGANSVRTARHEIRYWSGSDGKPMQHPDHPDGDGNTRIDNAHCHTYVPIGMRNLQWREAEIGHYEEPDKALDALYLPPCSRQVVSHVERWLASADWFHDRQLAWRTGIALTGPPGGGKTCLIRAIARHYDLPLHIFDLATMYNDEFRRQFAKAAVSAPCIILFEDIDNVFEGRHNKVGHLSFDCLLNTIDGVQTFDGVLLAITTNKPDQLDAALGVRQEQGQAARPGRINLVVELGHIPREGKLYICRKYLADRPDLWDELADQFDPETAAQFDSRCSSLALQLYWEAASHPPTSPLTEEPPCRHACNCSREPCLSAANGAGGGD